MVFKKPYAFLIKNFKIIHIILCVIIPWHLFLIIRVLFVETLMTRILRKADLHRFIRRLINQLFLIRDYQRCLHPCYPRSILSVFYLLKRWWRGYFVTRIYTDFLICFFWFSTAFLLFQDAFLHTFVD